ncbi:hypothetical protein TUM20985_40110 [Mycobacterium antarcticum]|uniref:cytochrome C oxidase subunit IV family protein n=1 Tax=unclassified Mycolicibacterium TaxID=2636767 RepID=UPI002398FF41|nr:MULTISPECIES: cytochrome C oxidase subunit IV family protein [unclassified Mycolicibacterium]BDX33464.1 hypothetical protein TUM20985_40110 [Mycolicibacterium sp. TUM20985]GLP82923.1 hypothetical protein TUM20984_43430 [Mycolicibacterium sp. TUM20984]
MNTVVRTNATLVWAVLSVLTVVSWSMGISHGFGGGNHLPASIVILVVAVFKIRLVGLYFMELRDAPVGLRGVFEGYCVVLLALLIVMYSFG